MARTTDKEARETEADYNSDPGLSGPLIAKWQRQHLAEAVQPGGSRFTVKGSLDFYITKQDRSYRR